MLFYSDDPYRDFDNWDAWCQKENQRIRYERELEESRALFDESEEVDADED